MHETNNTQSQNSSGEASTETSVQTSMQEGYVCNIVMIRYIFSSS